MLRQISPGRNPALNRIITVAWMGFLTAGILSNPMFSYPGRDGGIFLYIGSLILKGKLPYLDVWENKGPLVFYLNALGLFLTNGSRWGIWILEFLFFLGAAWIGYVVVKRTMAAVPALVGTFVWVTAAGNVLQGGNFSEEYSLLFSFLATLGLLNSLEWPQKRFFPFLIGISLGLNILLRPNNISIQVAAMGVYSILAITTKDWRLFFERIALILAGAAIIIVPVVVYFASQGALTEMIDIVLIFNFQYSEGKDLSGVLGGLINGSAAIGFGFIALALTGYVLSLISLIRRGFMEGQMGGILLLLVLGWPVEAVLSTLSGRNYPHYFIGWAPYVGLISAYAIHILTSRFARRLENYSILVLLALAAVVFVARPDVWRNYGTALTRAFDASQSEMEYVDPVAAYIRENTSPDQEVFIWGFRPIINFVSGRESPASFLPYPLVHVKTSLGSHWAEQFYAQFTSDPPVLIVNMIDPADRDRIPDLDPVVRKQERIKYKSVVLAPNLGDMLNFIDENYVLMGKVDGNDIYRLKTALP